MVGVKETMKMVKGKMMTLNVKKKEKYCKKIMALK
jgi:hypothetical protein